MKIRIILAFLFMSSYVFAESYVDSKAEFKVPIGQEQQADMTNTIKATPGEEFVIKLDTNPTTGYEWQLAKPIDDSKVKLVNSEYVPDNTGLVGSGGKSIWTFKALQVGKVQLSFKYFKSWEKDSTPAKEKSYVVGIQNEW